MKRDPIIARRDKLVAGLKEQKLVHAAALNQEDHRVERDKWMSNDMGERVLVKTHRRIRPWFFEQDGGWYMQCRYGARVIAAKHQTQWPLFTPRIRSLIALRLTAPESLLRGSFSPENLYVLI